MRACRKDGAKRERERVQERESESEEDLQFDGHLALVDGRAKLKRRWKEGGIVNEK